MKNLTNLAALSEELEDTARISVAELKTALVHHVVRFITAFKGLGDPDFRQVSVSYMFTTPLDDLQYESSHAKIFFTKSTKINVVESYFYIGSYS